MVPESTGECCKGARGREMKEVLMRKRRTSLTCMRVLIVFSLEVLVVAQGRFL